MCVCVCQTNWKRNAKETGEAHNRAPGTLLAHENWWTGEYESNMQSGAQLRARRGEKQRIEGGRGAIT